MTRLIQDFRYAVRQFRKSPGFISVAVITLALGIGANTAIFSVVNAVLLRPFPYRDPGALVKVWGVNPKKGVDVDPMSPGDFHDLRNQSHVFQEIGSSTDQVYNLTNAGDPESLLGYQLSANFFGLLGADPILGRTFASGEDISGHDHVVVLSYRLWQRRLGGDPEVLGKAITLNGEPYTVIGVMSRDFYYPVRDNELWTPFVIPPAALADRSVRFLRVLARLKPSVSLQQAQAEADTIAAGIAAQHADTNSGQSTRIVSIEEEATRDIRPALLALMGAVGFVLLIACANVANLLLARSVRRRGEIAVRTALGASRWQLVQQFLAESVLLGLIGGALGVLLASLSVNSLVRMFPPTVSNLNIPRVESIPIDGKVLGFALVVSLLTGVLFGVAPALRSRTNLRDSLQEAGRGLRGSRSGAFRGALAVSEVALSLVLLVGAGLLVKSFVDLMGRKLGFTSEGVLTFRVILPDAKYASETQQRNFADQVLRGVQGLPGVRSAGTVTFLPLSGWYSVRTFSIVGAPSENRVAGPPVVWSAASPDFFHTMEIPTLRGRSLTEQDSANGEPVAVVSQSLARRYWPDGNSVGEMVTLEYEKAPRKIVGVVGDVRHFGAIEDATPQVYVPYQQASAPLFCFAVRTDLPNPLSLATAVQRAVWAIDKDQPVSHVMTMNQLVSESIAPQRVLMVLLAGFAGLALVLAAVGVYSVMAYNVVERTREIGIRMALGAGRGEVLRLTLLRGMALTLPGIGFGIVGAWMLTRFLSTLLYGVKPTDPATFVAVSMILICAASLASYIPARRAAKVDPMVALRYE
jgi:putative ABC transport system permease protein